MVLKNGTHGILNRVDGPAIESPDGTAYQWIVNGNPHREGAPAVVTATLTEWWLNGHRHRIGGPAVEDTDSRTKEWWENGQFIRKEKY